MPEISIQPAPRPAETASGQALSEEKNMNQYERIEKSILDSENLDELAKCLCILLNGNFAVWTNGALYNIKQLVAMHNGLRIEIYPDEHPPPHFHVKGGDINASFSMADCELIAGRIDGRSRALVEWWHKRGKNRLIAVWNDTRPSGCSVGFFMPSEA
jgi:hypothetical protein